MSNEPKNGAPIAPVDRPAPSASTGAPDSAAALSALTRQLSEALAELHAVRNAPAEEPRGFATSEAKLAVIGPVVGILLVIAIPFLPPEVGRWVGMLAAACGLTLPVYPISRGLAKSGNVGRALPLILTGLLLAGTMGGTACKGPGGDTDYVLRSSVDGAALQLCEEHRQWGARLVELGELSVDRYASALDGAAIVRHLFAAPDVNAPIEPVEPPEVVGPPALDSAPGPVSPANGGTLDPYREYR